MYYVFGKQLDKKKQRTKSRIAVASTSMKYQICQILLPNNLQESVQCSAGSQGVLCCHIVALMWVLNIHIKDITKIYHKSVNASIKLR